MQIFNKKDFYKITSTEKIANLQSTKKANKLGNVIQSQNSLTYFLKQLRFLP